MEKHVRHDNNYYDLILSMSGFYMTSYYFFSCGKYDHKELHNCGMCRLCYRFNEECTVTTLQPCDDCGRSFWNPQCSAIHKQIRLNGTFYCEQLFVCKQCGMFGSLLRREEKGAQRKCGEMYCKTCDTNDQQAGHLCYLRTLKFGPPS